MDTRVHFLQSIRLQATYTNALMYLKEPYPKWSTYHPNKDYSFRIEN